MSLSKFNLSFLINLTRLLRNSKLMLLKTMEKLIKCVSNLFTSWSMLRARSERCMTSAHSLSTPKSFILHTKMTKLTRFLLITSTNSRKEHR